MKLARHRNLFRLLVSVALVFATLAHAADPMPKLHDVLVYKNGDRLQGRLITRSGGTIVFQSDRFGELWVPADQAVVIPGDKPDAPAPVAATPATEATKVEAKKVAKEAEAMSRWEVFTPAQLAAHFRAFFGPWHGKVAFSTEMVSDSTDRTNLSLEGLLDRKWNSNEIQLKGRYDFSATSGDTTTDLLKAEGLVRHDYPNSSFVLYHPTVEWNQASYTNGLPSDYVLLQQEFGTGYSFLNTPAHKLRVGVSENLFDNWSISLDNPHTSRSVQSTFVETELKIPWGLLLTERAVYYYSFTSQEDGWENHVELSKKFTQTFSTSIRHELRRGAAEVGAQDYTRLKLLIGVDF